MATGSVKLLVHGASLGILAGLSTVCFDAIFLFSESIYFPPDFPVALLLSSVAFWFSVGCVSALLLLLFRCTRFYKPDQEAFYWFLFFIIPFAFLYAILGKLNLATIVSPSLDHYFSFFWLALLIVLLFFSKKKLIANKKAAIAFLPEIVAVVLIFQFGANLPSMPFVRSIAEPTQLSDMQLLMKYLTALSMLLPPCIVLLCYVVFFYRVTLKCRSDLKYISIGFIAVAGWVSAAYLIGNAKHQSRYSTKHLKTEHIKNAGQHNVFLIVLDTVRADRLSVYGPHTTTPHLKQFAQDAVVYENCIAVSSWTRPSHVSLFTGLYPIEHGHHHRPAMKGLSFKKTITQFKTLATTFQEAGYQTAGIVSNFIQLHRSFGIDKGFEIYDDSKGCGSLNDLPHKPLLPLLSYITHIMSKYYPVYRVAEDINRNIMHVLENELSAPFFMFCNYMDAHIPYFPPRPFNSLFLDHPLPLVRKLMYSIPGTAKNNKDYTEYLLSQYDGEIAYLDRQLGALFAFLKEKKLYDSALIVITSDHGELFGEHGLYEHNCRLYEGVVKVPLLIKFPFQKKTGRNSVKITLADLYATILSICGLPIEDTVSGSPFGDAVHPPVAQFFRHTTGEHHALYEGPYKLMHYARGKDQELYNLESDPEEKNNIIEDFPFVARKMSENLHRWKQQHKPQYKKETQEIAVPDEVRNGLKALGYIE